MRPELPDGERHGLIERLRVDAHGVADAVVAGERDGADAGGHEERISCSLCVRLNLKILAHNRNGGS
jgi:hypothetical protein